MSLSKNAAIAEIKAGLAEAEKAIRNHPAETVAVYEEGLRAFREGQDGVDSKEAMVHANAVGLTVDEFKMVRLYLVAMAFMAAWYHRHGDKAHRNMASQSASTLVAATGISPEKAFKEFLRHEHLWRSALASHGIGRRVGLGCAPVLIVTALSAAALALR